jgi:hypothetical protein
VSFNMAALTEDVCAVVLRGVSSSFAAPLRGKRSNAYN